MMVVGEFCKVGRMSIRRRSFGKRECSELNIKNCLEYDYDYFKIKCQSLIAHFITFKL